MIDIGLVGKLQDHVLECHENVEFRVRIAAGQVMGSLCKHAGLPLFLHFLPSVIEGVFTNLERNIDAPSSEAELSLQELNLAKERDVNLSRSSLSIFHDTAGWKNLETWMKCLQEMVVSLPAEEFVKVDRTRMLELIFRAVEHVNRFVRETGFDVLETLISRHCCYKDPNNPSSQANYIEIARSLLQGLSDNWSQVRMAASKAVRTFFDTAPPPGFSRYDVYPILLPAMCLNRYYVAEGVRIYSQATWCRVTQGEGKALLGRYLDSALKYYIQQSDSDNHAVREAACAAIAETIIKLDPQLLKPFVVQLLDAFLVCFGDESWPVRDAACIALGSLISKFATETRLAGHETLLADYFLRNLSDCIPSVREGAARSIAQILRATGDKSLTEFYLSHIRNKLTGIKLQPADSHGADSHRLSGRGPGASHVTVHSGANAHDSRHTDQVMYSCGSLAPKLHKGRRGGGCHDGLTQRASEPWEEADGAIRLIGQIAEDCPNLFTENLIIQLLQAAAYKDYTHYPYFLQTACDVIAQLCRGLEKPTFKKHLDDLLIVLAAAIDSKLPLAEAASLEALNFIAGRLGPNVLRGRLENHVDPFVRNLMQHLPPIC